jgi:hypothetical protein
VNIALGDTVTISGDGAVVDGTTNYLTDAASKTENDAALFTNDTLVINSTEGLDVIDAFGITGGA